LVARKEAQAMSETEILPTEPMTVVLSTMGWIRAAKGHEVDPTTLSYKAGDTFLAAARGRSNQPVIFLDTTGRAYSLPIHTLPSARGQGEPLTGRLNPPPNAQFIGLLLGEPTQKYILASDAGYGFIVTLENLFGKNRAGKTALTVPNGAKAMLPRMITDAEQELIATVSNTGHLLIFPLKELPELSKGKGNKIMNIPSSKIITREEYVVSMAILHKQHLLVVHAGNKKLKLKPSDWQHYVGERGRRGNKLPRAFQKADNLSIE
ncbi:MAG: DNA topoisomerase IV subunit A, partial [Gammaproteobacteria bacterium]|nr:DNA topoisomerase IV subunit A [Gammaproteobacteria bacterium]